MNDFTLSVYNVYNRMNPYIDLNLEKVIGDCLIKYQSDSCLNRAYVCLFSPRDGAVTAMVEIEPTRGVSFVSPERPTIIDAAPFSLGEIYYLASALLLVNNGQAKELTELFKGNRKQVDRLLDSIYSGESKVTLHREIANMMNHDEGSSTSLALTARPVDLLRFATSLFNVDGKTQSLRLFAIQPQKEGDKIIEQFTSNDLWYPFIHNPAWRRDCEASMSSTILRFDKEFNSCVLIASEFSRPVQNGSESILNDIRNKSRLVLMLKRSRTPLAY
mgnify:CR=1 FL=1